MGHTNREKTARLEDRVTADPTSGQAAIPCIVHFSGRMTGVSYSLSLDKELIIGRAPEADISIPDRRISQRHARVVVSSDGTVFVEDLGSTNGTCVNGKKITRQALSDGDKVQISRNYILKFCYETNVVAETAGRNGVNATRDALTGAYSKQSFLVRIEEDFNQARKQNEELALLIFSVDDWAKINATHGTNAGDMVLRAVAKLVNATLQREAVLARYDNNAFALLLRNMSEGGVVVLAQRIRRIVKNYHFILEGGKIPLTVSLGIGTLTKNMKNALDMIHAVQAYLDKAKRAGHNTINGSQSIRAIYRQITNKHAA
ncbi:MAG: diguanylate cyclase domain-containing protein [Sulfuricaulis sp.]